MSKIEATRPFILLAELRHRCGGAKQFTGRCSAGRGRYADAEVFTRCCNPRQRCAAVYTLARRAGALGVYFRCLRRRERRAHRAVRRKLIADVRRHDAAAWRSARIAGRCFVVAGQAAHRRTHADRWCGGVAGAGDQRSGGARRSIPVCSAGRRNPNRCGRSTIHEWVNGAPASRLLPCGAGSGRCAAALGDLHHRGDCDERAARRVNWAQGLVPPWTSERGTLLGDRRSARRGVPDHSDECGTTSGHRLKGRWAKQAKKTCWPPMNAENTDKSTPHSCLCVADFAPGLCDHVSQPGRLSGHDGGELLLGIVVATSADGRRRH